MTGWQMIGGALGLNPAAFDALTAAEYPLRIALLILLAAGTSQALGQSAALLAHRVRPRRFLLALGISALVFAGSVVVWAGALSLSAIWLLDATAPLSLTVAIVGLAHAPRLFGFVTLIPYFGSGVAATLTIWTFLATAVGARAIFAVDLPSVLLVVGAAWLLTESASRTIGIPIVAATRRLRRWSARTPRARRERAS